MNKSDYMEVRDMRDNYRVDHSYGQVQYLDLDQKQHQPPYKDRADYMVQTDISMLYDQILKDIQRPQVATAVTKSMAPIADTQRGTGQMDRKEEPKPAIRGNLKIAIAQSSLPCESDQSAKASNKPLNAPKPTSGVGPKPGKQEIQPPATPSEKEDSNAMAMPKGKPAMRQNESILRPII